MVDLFTHQCWSNPRPKSGYLETQMITALEVNFISFWLGSSPYLSYHALLKPIHLYYFLKCNVSKNSDTGENTRVPNQNRYTLGHIMPNCSLKNFRILVSSLSILNSHLMSSTQQNITILTATKEPFFHNNIKLLWSKYPFPKQIIP